MKHEYFLENNFNVEDYRQPDGKFYMVYIVFNLINGKRYLGKHSTNNLNDGYLGSGVLISRAIKKYGKENFKRKILCLCKSEENAFYREYVYSKLLDVDKNDIFYNLQIGGEGSASGEDSFHFNRKRSEETCLKISKSLKGKTASIETKIKLSESHKGLTWGDQERESHRIAWSKVMPVKCPYCKTEGRGGIMIRYHFENCKLSPKYEDKYVTCPYCNKKLSVRQQANLNRFHFDNCIKNPNNKNLLECPHCGRIGNDVSVMNQFHFNNCNKK